MIYHNSVKKLQARNETIIQSYRNIFNKKCLPKEKQYWTLCSNNVIGNQIAPNSELDQILKEGLIKPYQYNGVDSNTEIINKNSKLKFVNWHVGDFYSVLAKNSNLDNFNPGIINCDLISMKYQGTILVSKILSLISNLKIKDIMIITNYILKQRIYKNKPEEILKTLYQNDLFKLYGSYWKIYGDSESKYMYIYKGSGKNTTIMGTLIFYCK